jgi:hypothetical protein
MMHQKSCVMTSAESKIKAQEIPWIEEIMHFSTFGLLLILYSHEPNPFTIETYTTRHTLLFKTLNPTRTQISYTLKWKFSTQPKKMWPSANSRGEKKERKDLDRDSRRQGLVFPRPKQRVTNHSTQKEPQGVCLQICWLYYMLSISIYIHSIISKSKIEKILLQLLLILRFADIWNDLHTNFIRIFIFLNWVIFLQKIVNKTHCTKHVYTHESFLHHICWI